MANKIVDGSKEIKLTAKQRAFCEKYVSCYNTIQSYKDAFDTQDYHTASRNGIKLLKRPEILAYIAELQAEAVKQAGINAAKYIKVLDNMVFDPKTSENGKLRAIEVLSKMEGFNAPEKVEAKLETTVINVGFDE